VLRICRCATSGAIFLPTMDTRDDFILILCCSIALRYRRRTRDELFGWFEGLSLTGVCKWATESHAGNSAVFQAHLSHVEIRAAIAAAAAEQTSPHPKQVVIHHSLVKPVNKLKSEERRLAIVPSRCNLTTPRSRTTRENSFVGWLAGSRGKELLKG